MEVTSVDIEKIVRQVFNEMKPELKPGISAKNGPDTAIKSGSVPAMAKAAVLVAKEKFEIREYPIPPTGDDELLVKVEGCGVCGTDAHEYRKDPFGLIPLVLGHEGSGTIAQLGKNVTRDSAGRPVKVGDRIVTCVIFGDDPAMTMFDMNKFNVSEKSDVYGLLPDDNVHLNGWFSEYLVVRGGSTFFVVNDLDLDMRLLIEPSAVVVHAAERAKLTNILRFNSRVAVQGCGPIGLLLIAVLRTMGIENIIAVDGEEKRLALAHDMGATKTVNFKNYRNTDVLVEAIKDLTDGNLADFAFQCTGSPQAASTVWKFVRRGGGLCELGFFVDNGDATINPHLDICKKEITLVGSWVYTLRDYPTTFDFLKRAKGIGLPLEKLITHRFGLDKIDDALKTNVKMDGIKIAYVNNV
ncbi:MAG: zinc-binding dehydrogenase [Defluviitaleaceae bacterium]|nr:zinc-binding dehydrogenase [Defluviitaleaceae bacterium]